ncbi:alpha-amylase [Aplysia californica]|uniref:Alpha-amylase n=1 Tax=Aplysia californica TaxID=6500 RepID=A0ABM0JBB7_APLCA|nr:alpha-amylase [Aplysia californica]
MFTLLIAFAGLFAAGQAAAAYHDPHCDGRQVIVHLFEWKWTDIAKECERYLGPKGFCGVQTSPANEHAIVTTDAMRPWWERYQPVSYKLVSRSGNEAQFKDMVQRCKNVGVRIFVDVVVNHMAGLGRVGPGSGGSQFNSDNLDFPGVPFSKQNFNAKSKCPSGDGNVNDYNNPANVRNCYLVGLTDLDQSQSYVQDKIAGFFNHMIDIGVAGFRVDAAKHMWPNDFKAIQGKTKNLPEGGRPFFYQEVIDRNDGAIKVNEYFDLGYVTEFRYLQKVRDGANDLGRLGGVYDPGWGMAPSDQAFVFVDNHDTQRGGGSLTYKNGAEFTRANAFTLAYNYGFTRVMSSYYFNGDAEGPPHNSDYSTKDVTIKSDGSCGNGWVCEHRWKPIGNMAAFRNYVAGTDVNNWKYEGGVLSFSRGNKGFFAMSNNDFNKNIHTNLPAGEYCDLISECGTKIKVDGSGNAQVKPASGSDPFVAIITGDVGGGFHPGTVSPGGDTNTQAPGTLPPYHPPADGKFVRTIIMMQKQTVSGQDLFIRGGIDHKHRSGCTNDATTSACAIPIKHLADGTSNHFAGVNAWKKGDNFLDWYGAESGQGSFHGRKAQGTPAFWSTNDKSNAGYNALNTYGPHYWIIDIEMDCSRAKDGFFEFKALLNGGWEGDVPASSTCTGADAGTPPYSSKNHFGRCGYVNVFHWGQGTCEVLRLPSS